MALTAYMLLTGDSQGEITGECRLGGVRSDRIPLYHMDHNVEAPPENSRAGARHQPFIVVKAKDISSPKLFRACCTAEQCTVAIFCFRGKDAGEEEHYFTVTLENARIARIREYTPMTFLPENKPFRDMEEISFTYSKITWQCMEDGSAFTDEPREE